MTTTATTRNATLADLQTRLMDDQAHKADYVVDATALRARDGMIRVAGVEPLLTDTGVTMLDGVYRPTAVFDEGVADKLGIPVGYVRKIRAERPDLYDANVNGWLHGKSITRATTGREVIHPADTRRFLIRTFTAGSGREGVARALLSDSYRVLDHIDAITAALTGVRAAGVDATIVGCDLTERRMSVRVAVPQVRALANVLLDGYRSPFGNGRVTRAGDHQGIENLRLQLGTTTDPVVFAGFEIGNSETGGGALTITPRVIALACMNGMPVVKDAQRSVHLGGKLKSEGLIDWSDDTQRRSIELVQAKTADVVRSVCSQRYLDGIVAEVEQQAATPVHADAALATVTRVGKALAFGEDVTRDVFAHFLAGGQLTAGGVLNAVTSVAQTIADADRAAEIEATALRALALAAA